MKRGILALLVLGLWGFCIPSDTSAKTSVESLVEQLPDHTLGFIATSGGEALAEPFNQSMIGQLWHDPGVQQFVRQFVQSIKNRIEKDLEDKEEFQSAWDLSWQMTKKSLDRPILLGIAEIPNAPEGDVPVYGFIIMDTTGRRESYEQLLQKCHSLADEGEITQKEIAGRMMFTDTDEEEPVYWGWVDQYLVCAINDDCGAAMQYLSGPSNRPATKHTMALQKVKASHDALVIHADLNRIWKLMRTEMFSDDEDRLKADKVLQILGLNQLNGITYRLGFSQQDMVLDMLMEAPQPHRGLLGIAKPVNLAALDRVEKQASSANIGHLDIAVIYDTILQVLREILSDPDEYQEVEQAIQAAEAKIGFSIRQEMLASIAGPIISYNIPAGTIMETPYGGFVLLLELRNAATMESCLTKIDNLIQQFSQGQGIGSGVIQANTVQQEGKTLHAWTIAPMAMLAITPTWTVTENQLVIASHPVLALRAARQIEDPVRHANSIRSTPGFQQVAKDLPPSLLSFRYTNTPVELKQSLVLAQQFWPLMTMGFKEAGLTMPAMLPMLDHLIAKMGPSCEYGWSDAVGVHFHSQGSLPSGAASLPSGAASLTAGSALGVSILLPALGRAREMANQVKCASQLKGLGCAIIMYQNDFNGRNPKTLQELFDTVDVSPMALVCPSSNDEIGQCSYIYRGADLNETSDPEMIVAYDKYDNHNGEERNVLFADGHVDRCQEEQFQELIRKDNELRRKTGLPEIPADVEPAQPIQPEKKHINTF